MSLRTAVIEALGLIEGAFPGRLPADHQRTITTWIMFLEGMEPVGIVEATKDICSSPREYPPSVGQVRHRAAELSLGHLAPPSPFEAWERVQRRVMGDDVTFSDEEKRALDVIGGIRTAQHSQNIGTDRAHFFQAYRAIVERKLTEVRAHNTTKQLAENNAPPPPALPPAPVRVNAPPYGDRLTPPPEHRTSDPKTVSSILDGLNGYREEYPNSEPKSDTNGYCDGD